MFTRTSLLNNIIYLPKVEKNAAIQRVSQNERSCQMGDAEGARNNTDILIGGLRSNDSNSYEILC